MLEASIMLLGLGWAAFLVPAAVPGTLLPAAPSVRLQPLP